MWAAVSALSLAVQLALCVFNFFSFILFLSKLNDDDDDMKYVCANLTYLQSYADAVTSGE